MRVLRILFAVLAASVAVASAAAGESGPARQTAQTARLSEPDQETIKRVEDYLSGIETMHARFLQTASNGSTAKGEVWVQRPGKLRFEYEPPHPALIVSNGTLLLYYDKSLEQTSYVPISETPLWFLVRADIDMSRIEGYEVVAVDAEDKTLRIAIAQEGGKAGQPGSIVLVFQDDPLQLKKWRIVDQQGVTTEVALMDPRFGVTIDSAKFDFGALDLPERKAPDGGR